MDLSVVIPVYNESIILNKLVEKIQLSVESLKTEHEFIFIDDGSTDGTLSQLIRLKKNNSKIKIIELSRNFGHQAAYTAGLHLAKGDFILMMDGDLQDPPELISQFYQKISTENFDMVIGKRIERKENFLKKLLIKQFHFIFNKVQEITAHDSGNFAILSRKSLTALLQLQEKSRYLPGLRTFIGFKQGFIEYQRSERPFGKSKMPYMKLFKLAFDALFSFSNFPIKLSLVMGIMGILLSFIGVAIVIYKKFTGVAIIGWTSTMLSIFFFGSVQLFFLGVLGEYIFRVFKETQNRPLYIVRHIYE